MATARGVLALILATVVPAVSVAETPALDPETVRRALVFCHAPYLAGTGVLVNDARTVIFPAAGLQTGHAVSCRPLDSDEGDTEGQVSVFAVGGPTFLVVTLDADVPAGHALSLSRRTITPGDPVWVPETTERPDGSLAVDLVETTATAVARQRIAIDGAPWLEAGAPVLDADGHVVAVLSEPASATRASEILQPANLAEQRLRTVPIFGMRLGADLGGFMDEAFALDMEAGAALWGQLSLTARLGFSVAGASPASLPPIDGFGPGAASGIPVAFNAGAAVRYRLLLHETDGMPFHLAFAVEAHYSAYRLSTEGSAVYGEAGCDPATEPCRVVWRDAPDLPFEHAVGPAFGIDVVIGTMTLGYRYLPAAASYGLPGDLHRISVGMGFL